MSAEKLLFVYGTLKRGGVNHAILAGQKFIGEASTAAGYVLYNLSGYPGMIAQLDVSTGVVGELWSVDDAALSRLDTLEGVDEDLFRRERIPLLPPFADREVEGYIYARSVKGCVKLGTVWQN